MGISRPVELALGNGSPITRNQIVERARSWLRPSVAYSQSGLHTNEYGTYRTDCSGYVSMAWALPGTPPDRHGGLDTIGLAAISIEIAKNELRAGDVLLRAEGTNLTRHVTIFHRWADAGGGTYWGFEQAGGTGTVHRVISYPYDNAGSAYRGARYLRLQR